ncbi:Methylmalonic aciduria and homocystinuria type C -like protein [Trichinella spiralis]|uniref:Cyanocobalamin reductase (cyanide-eliminating) n=1 Tax=Trichinella spiralis TaxID=6334 RepID=A0A0V1BZM6_TRISP|nr:Methylmalonic aciduria and homocystinuria type C -like protein [Trichinella spiralis]
MSYSTEFISLGDFKICRTVIKKIQNIKKPYIFVVDAMSSRVMQLCKKQFCDDIGFECHPFKVQFIQWYNDLANEHFHLDYEADTLAILVLSTPRMFSNFFLPWLKQRELLFDCMRDPLDLCMKECAGEFLDLLPQDVVLIHDFDMWPNRRPKVLMNVAGHASGAAFYYQRMNVEIDPWDKQKRIAGVSIHPKYGGWFAFRFLYIFPSIVERNLVQHFPVDLLNADEKIVDLLDKFNNSWRTAAFRDVVPVKERYDPRQMEYFHTEPSRRKQLLKSWLQEIIV